MNGGLVHENILLAPVERALRQCGVAVERQVPTRPCREGGYGDLVAVLGPRRLLIEAEMSSRRIANDLQKALDLGATWLWILVPNCRVASAVRRQMKRMRVREMEPWVCVLTLGQTLERIRKYVPLFSVSMTEGKTNTDGTGALQGCEYGHPLEEPEVPSHNETEGTRNAD